MRITNETTVEDVLDALPKIEREWEVRGRQVRTTLGECPLCAIMNEEAGCLPDSVAALVMPMELGRDLGLGLVVLDDFEDDTNLGETFAQVMGAADDNLLLWDKGGVRARMLESLNLRGRP